MPCFQNLRLVGGESYHTLHVSIALYLQYKSCINYKAYPENNQNLAGDCFVVEGKEVRVVFFCLSKAFDMVWHRGLIPKLKHNGIWGPLLNWFICYFTYGVMGPLVVERSQFGEMIKKRRLLLKGIHFSNAFVKLYMRIYMRAKWLKPLANID